MAYTEAFIKKLLDNSGFCGCTGFKSSDDGRAAEFYWGEVCLATVRLGATAPEYHIKNDAMIEQMKKLLEEAEAMEVV